MIKKLTKLQKAKIKAILKLLLALLTISIFYWIGYQTITYPEKYLTTWRYQLHNDLIQGDADAWTYYQNTYLANGVILYQDI